MKSLSTSSAERWAECPVTASYRLPREALDHEIEVLMKAGFKAVCGISAGTDIRLDSFFKSRYLMLLSISRSSIDGGFYRDDTRRATDETATAGSTGFP